MVKLVAFHDIIKASSSRPLVVSDASRKKYILKPKGGGDGVLANIVEWIAYKLALEIHLPVVPHALLQVDKKLCEQVGDPEIHDPLVNSLGTNFGTEYLENAIAYKDQKIEKKLKTNLFLFDLFLLNIDRTEKNANLIIDDGQVKSLDFASSLTLRFCVDDSFFNFDSVLKEIRKHPFYADKIDPELFIKSIMDIPDDNIKKIITDMPDEWVKEYYDASYIKPVKQALIKRLTNIRNSVPNIRTSLTVLQTVRLESEAERQKRVEDNKKAFVKKFGDM